MAGKRIRRKRAAQPRGLEAAALTGREPPAAVQALAWQIEKDNGSVIGIYRDPLGGHWQILAGLPADAVQPTPYQRDLSATHVARLAAAIESLGRFLDPIIAVPAPEGGYWTPNGHHRLAALKELGAKSVVALVVPEVEVARRILLLNTEKAHNLRERSLEVVRLAEALARLDDRPEREFEAEFEEPALLTLGLCYRRDGRFSGGAYHPVLKRVEKFMGVRLSKALEERQARASLVLELNEAVNEVVKQLKDRGFQSPYLKSFVVARVNPLRFKRGAKAEFEETIGKMLAGARRFDVSKVRPEQLAGAAGPPEEE
jgi:ParB family chromosome partitioning protein